MRVRPEVCQATIISALWIHLLRRYSCVKPWRRQPLLLAILLAALFVRALVPAGFMPAQGELVELCTMHGARMVLTDPATGEILEQAGENANSDPACPWSLLLSTLAGPALDGAGEADPPATPFLPGRAYSLSIRSAISLPPVRAPPSLS